MTLSPLRAFVARPLSLVGRQVEYPADYLAKWDRETAARRLTGVAANDCHHNMVMLVKMVNSDTVKVGTIVDRDEEMRSIPSTLRPGIRELTRGHHPGDILVRVDLDPYHRSFRNVCTHVLAPELTEPAIRQALRGGHAYVCHDWMCDPTGFAFDLIPASVTPSGLSAASHAIMGDEMKLEQGARLLARFPVSCHVRLLKSGAVIAERHGESIEHAVTTSGVYRVEGWLDVVGEERGWVYSNPIYVR